MEPRECVEYILGNCDIIDCPICEAETLNNHFICPKRGWEYDGHTQTDEYSSANFSTVGNYRLNYHK